MKLKYIVGILSLLLLISLTASALGFRNCNYPVALNDVSVDASCPELENGEGEGNNLNYTVSDSTMANHSIVKVAIKGNAEKSIITDDKCKSLKSATFSSGGNLPTEVPEFPTIALPVAAMLGLMFIFGRRKEE